MKKILAALLALLMAVSLVACGSGAVSSQQQEPVSESAEENQTIDFSEDPYEINILYPVTGEAQPDLQLVQDAANEIVRKEINATITLEPVSLFTMANTHALKASSQEKMDLLCLMPGYKYLGNYANANMIQPLDELLVDWGGDITAVLGELMAVGQYNGKQYALPQNKTYGKNGTGFWLTDEMCDEYGIDPSAINSLDDITQALDKIKTENPDVIPLMPETAGGTIVANLLPQNIYAGLLTSYTTIVEENGKHTVVCLQEQKEYQDAASLVRQWYEAGYISKDVSTTQDGGKALQQAGKVFCTSSSSIVPSLSATTPIPRTCVMFESGHPVRTTKDDQTILWAVALNSERPDKCIQFMNLCYTNKELANILKWGVEGIHYEMTGDDLILRTDNYSGYTNNWDLYGDANLLYYRQDIIEGAGSSTAAEYRKVESDWISQMCSYAPYYGFMFDTVNVANEIAACDNVSNEFTLSIGNGTVDPETEIPKFINKLYDAGLQTIIDEMQAQLDAYMAGK